jgi:acetyltransferase
VDRHPLTTLFAPRSVALVGASDRPGSVGRAVLENLRAAHFSGRVEYVNSRHATVAGAACHATLADLREPVDLAVIASPAASVPGVLGDAGRAGIRQAVVLSAGFAETGAAGKALQAQALAAAREAGVRVLGPNCVGLIRPSIALNASFSRGTPATGGRRARLAVGSDLHRACRLGRRGERGHVERRLARRRGRHRFRRGAGLSPLRFADAQRLVVRGRECATDGAFVSALRALARAKPVIVLKVGRHAEGSRAAQSHTGALVGDDAVFDAVLARGGAVRVPGYRHLFAAARALVTHRKPAGPRLAIVTNGGGPGVLAADAAAQAGIPLATLSAPTLAVLDAVAARATGPTGIRSTSSATPMASASPRRRLRWRTIRRSTGSSPSSARRAWLPPRTWPNACCRSPRRATSRSSPPGWGRARSPPAAIAWIAVASRRTASPRSQVDAFAMTADWVRRQRLLLEAPPARAAEREPDRALPEAIFRTAKAEGRTLLTEFESKQLLAHYGIPVPPFEIARTVEEALAVAARIGFPVVMKVLSRGRDAQVGREWRAPQPALARGDRARVERDAGRLAAPSARRAFRRRRRASDGAAAFRPRAPPGREDRSGVRPGDHLRLGWRGGGAAARQRRRAPAAQRAPRRRPSSTARAPPGSWARTATFPPHIARRSSTRSCVFPTSFAICRGLPSST